MPPLLLRQDCPNQLCTAPRRTTARSHAAWTPETPSLPRWRATSRRSGESGPEAPRDTLDPRRTISERRIDAGLPQIGRFEHVRVRRENQRQHRHLLSDLIAGSTFGNRPIAVKVSAVET